MKAKFVNEALSDIFKSPELNIEDTLEQEGFGDVINVLNALDNLGVNYKLSSNVPIPAWGKGKIEIEIWIKDLKKYIVSYIDPKGEYEDRPMWEIQKWNKKWGIHGKHFFYRKFELVIENIKKAYNKKYSNESKICK